MQPDHSPRCTLPRARSPKQRDDLIQTGLVVLCALLMRAWFITSGLVLDPMTGDAIQYCNYAWNMLHAHVFSLAEPGSAAVTPDGFRDPGYPLLLALLMGPLGSGDTWYHCVLGVQALLGALTAGLTERVARSWLGARPALIVGLAVALWPHNVVMCDFLLSETLFGFTVVAALWLLARAQRRGKLLHWGAAGLGLGAAAMVNATLSPFGALSAAMLWLRKAAPRSAAAALLISSLLLPGAWAMRNAGLPPLAAPTGRALGNLVQGSWPEYHAAFMAAEQGDAGARETMSHIYAEMALAMDTPLQGLIAVFQRVAGAPWHYAAWYAWKPELLWGWTLRIGAGGDIYPYPILHPLYRVDAAMRAFESLCVTFNPVLGILMLGAAAALLARPAALRASPLLYATALLVAFETVVYTVLQSEPRYSIPLRPLQMLLAVTAGRWLWHCWTLRRQRPTGS